MNDNRPMILPDTNFFLNNEDAIHEIVWPLRPVEIVISEVVIKEIEGLTNNEESKTAENARWAKGVINKLKYHAARGQSLYQNGDLRISFVERPSLIKPPLDPAIPDHKIITTAQIYQEADPARFCIILSSDRELCHIAEALSIPAILLAPWQQADAAHSELQVKYEWWLKREKRSLSTKAEPTHESVEKRAAYFRKFIRHLHGQVRAASYRTILSVVQRQARIALTARMIQSVKKPDGRIIMVFTESRVEATYWVTGISRFGGFNQEEIQIVDPHNFNRLRAIRAIVFSHDQIATELPVYIARLTQARQRLTAVVDGCDLVDPAMLASILFDCDQFIGLSRNPAQSSPAIAHRLLNAFMRGRSILTYTFVDAQHDGWGHPFSFNAHSIAFSAEEKPDWDKVNNEYVLLRQQATRRYPQLNRAFNFWEELFYRVLAHDIAAEEAQLLTLREQREQLAVCAEYKGHFVEQLFAQESPITPYRRIILDYMGQWALQLESRLTRLGVTVAVLPQDNMQRAVWKQFGEGQIEVLLLSGVPDFHLANVALHQLIILTPLRPLFEISAVVDWALEHNKDRNVLQIDLLYVTGTPEQQAMLELKQVCFESAHFD